MELRERHFHNKWVTSPLGWCVRHDSLDILRDYVWTPNAGNNYSRNLWEESCHASMTTIRSLLVTVRLRITREDRGANHAKVNCAGFLTRVSTRFMEHPLFGEMNPCPAYPWWVLTLREKRTNPIIMKARKCDMKYVLGRNILVPSL